MRNVYLLIALAGLLGLAAVLAMFFGPQFELSGVPADIQALYMKGTQAKWKMIAGLVGFVALLVALLAGILWLNARRQK